MKLFNNIHLLGISCGYAPVVANSNPHANIYNGTRYKDEVTYTCLPGYDLRGSHTIQCQHNGAWSAAPSCVGK